MPQPDPFLVVRVDRVDPPVPLGGACVGYEQGRWRCRELSRHVLQWLPEFALKYSEWQDLHHGDAVVKVAEAARAVYASEKYERRGEFGEILLHILLRQHLSSTPAISKVYFKDHRNDTVKGFDAVHVTPGDGDRLQLWLGEVKFYKDITAAISAVVGELKKHTEADYLRAEFLAITNKLDRSWPLAERLRQMLPRTRSLDEIFSEICVPVLLTYDSVVVRDNDIVEEEYERAFREEVEAHWQSFKDALPELPIRIHLFLLPLEDKAELVREMHEALQHAQELV
jgi:hypothetical protein